QPAQAPVAGLEHRQGALRGQPADQPRPLPLDAGQVAAATGLTGRGAGLRRRAPGLALAAERAPVGVAAAHLAGEAPALRRLLGAPGLREPVALGLRQVVAAAGAGLQVVEAARLARLPGRLCRRTLRV